jgi:uncharacterized protein YecE (DUF72 family)
VFSGITSVVTATRPSVPGLYAGTSGFSFASWRPGFYPPEAKPADFLRLYSERLPSVELNNTFYRLPSEEQFRKWAETTPPDFRFAVKMTMSISHFGRLDELGTFCERVAALGDRLGPILVRPPDNRPRDDGWLQLLIGSVEPGLRLAFDLRHPSWDGVEETLGEAGAARVNALEGETAFRYLRFRDPPYDQSALKQLAGRVRIALDSGADVYCYFKHENEPTGPRYAGRLLELVS